MLKNIESLSGTHQVENDEIGYFCWASNTVKIKPLHKESIIIISGDSPLDNNANLIFGKFNIDIKIKNGHNNIIIPIKETETPLDIIFKEKLDIEGESRDLSFKIRNIEIREPILNNSVNVPSLIDSKGITTGSIHNIFSQGWLRMTAKLQDEGTLRFSGILYPPAKRRKDIILTANGRAIDNIRYNLFNKDYEALGEVGFEGEININDFNSDEFIRFSTEYRTDGIQAISCHQDWIWPLSNTLPIPDDSNKKRIGSTSDDWFLFSGASFVHKLSEVTATQSFREWDVLDWGCGCGRLTRHLMKSDFKSVTGADIDPINIEWCKNNLETANFQLVSPQIPTPFDDNQFNLIIGHSVFTHLSETEQYFWLLELNRILKPQGTAVVTIMADFSSAIDKFTIENYMSLKENGFLDVGWQEDGVDVLQPGYYRRIFHTIDYITSYWENYFHIEAILDGYSDHQTAIVLRKK
ncbi:class I SAM-dependent methyltransferase [Vibrio sp. MEBiC08052]|uniref:class I SAM-dependent methyltransferase n=1 Tax=Vibrio sp. MEBiC08052 TaxID=1761910 RepID=UPI000740774B|nr:class I SAM-dependent methyltransferase [Vibrio sp. MEBiC08052]KUJ00624.1 hypothetical protein VRK_01260 [Vibrio sp. MEBiC08052]